MAKDGIKVHIYGDYNNKDIDKAIRDLKSLKTDAGNTEQQFGKMSKGMKMAGIAVAAAAAGMAAAVGKFAISSISAASDLDESQSKVTQVFKDQADEVLAWADSSATAFGQSKQQALEAAGTYGNLLRAFGLSTDAAREMSVQMVELAADLASFNNTSIDDAIQAIRSGLSGETEPLKRFGVALTDARLKAEALAAGIYEGSGALDAGQKAQAAYALILKDTTLAQGDFARTADGLANTQRIVEAAVEDAKAAIGTGLVDAMGEAIDAMGGAQGLVSTIDDAADVFANFTEGVGDLARELSDLRPEINTTRSRLGEMADVLQSEFGWSALFDLPGAIADNISAFRSLVDPTYRAANVQAALNEVIEQNIDYADPFARGMHAAARAADDMASSSADAAIAGEAAARSLLEVAIATGQVPSAARFAQRFDVAAMLDGIGKAAASTGSSARSAGKAAETMKIKWADAAKGFSDAAVTIEGKAVTVSGALGKAFEERAGIFRNVINTQVALIQEAQRSLDDYAQSVTDSILGKIDFSMTDAEGEPMTPEQIAATILGDIENQTNAVKAIAESGIMTKLPAQLAQKILTLPPDAAVALANYFSANPAQLEQLTNNYNALAEYTKVALGVPMAETFATVGDQSAVEMIANAKERIGKAAENFKKYVKRKLSTTITVGVKYEAVNSLPGVSGGSINVTTNANGGKAMAGLPTLVGERGPELLVPSVDSTVVRGEKTRSLLKGSGGGDVYLTVNAGLGTDGRQVGRQIVEALKQYERSNGPVPIKVA